MYVIIVVVCVCMCESCILKNSHKRRERGGRVMYVRKHQCVYVCVPKRLTCTYTQSLPVCVFFYINIAY